jgi:hypothetical protein
MDRYDPLELGVVRTNTISNININININGGEIVVSSFKSLLKNLSISSGQSGNISGAIFRDEDIYEKDLNWLEEKRKKNNDQKRESYTIYDNNCATFVDDLLEYFGLASVPSSYNTPIVFMTELQLIARDIEYNFSSDTLEVDY